MRTRSNTDKLRKKIRSKSSTHIYPAWMKKFLPLNLAEQQVWLNHTQGQPTLLSENCPEQPTKENIIRAEFLQIIILHKIDNKNSFIHSFILTGAFIDGDINLNNSYIPHGINLLNSNSNSEIHLLDAHINGSLNLENTQIKSIIADRLTVQGNVFLKKNFTATGEIHLSGANISGDLDLNNAIISNGFYAEGINIGNSLICRELKSFSGISILGATINGQINFHNAYIFDKKIAVIADSIKSQQSIFFTGHCHVIGEIRLLGANIRGSIECDGATFMNPQKTTLNLTTATIGSLLLRNEFKSIGQINLSGTKIMQDFIFKKCTLDYENGSALLAIRLSVNGIFASINNTIINGNLNFSHARVEQWLDDFNTTNSKPNSFVFNGLVYQSFAGDTSKNADIRTTWLKQQIKDDINSPKTFKHQPWKQLRETLINMGYYEDSRKVAITYENHIRKLGLIGQADASDRWYGQIYQKIYKFPPNCFHWLFGIMTGYGYRPLRLFFITLIVWMGCAMWYWSAAINGVFAPSNPLVFDAHQYRVCRPETFQAKNNIDHTIGSGNWYLCGKLASEYTGFSPLAFSLDVVLPLVDLHQELDWSPIIPTPKESFFDEFFSFTKFHITRIIIWLEILYGWIASLLLVAIVSGLAKRKDE